MPKEKLFYCCFQNQTANQLHINHNKRKVILIEKNFQEIYVKKLNLNGIEKEFILKKLRLTFPGKQEQDKAILINMIKNEYKWYMMLKCEEYILKCNQIIWNKEYYKVIHEYNNEITLNQYLQEETKALSPENIERNKLIIARTIIQMLSFLHSKKIFYGFLSLTGGILVNIKNGIVEVKIHNFIFTREIKEGIHYQCSDLYSRCKEYSRDLKKISKRIEIYTFGILMLYVIFPSLIDEIENNFENYIRRLRKEVLLEKLILKCLNKNPRSRPTAEEIYKKIGIKEEKRII